MIYLIDFGLAKEFRNHKGDHIQYRTGKNFVGTARYASLNMHLGVEQSRRDDLEALGFALIYLLKGSLPWQGLKKTKQDKFNAIKQKKFFTTVELLCKDQPKEFATYLTNCRQLQFEETPNYSYLR